MDKPPREQVEIRSETDDADNGRRNHPSAPPQPSSQPASRERRSAVRFQSGSSHGDEDVLDNDQPKPAFVDLAAQAAQATSEIPSAHEASLNRDWSNESIFGSESHLRMSESPTGISGSEDEKPVRVAKRSSEEEPRKGGRRERSSGHKHPHFVPLEAPESEIGEQKSHFHLREKRASVRSPASSPLGVQEKPRLFGTESPFLDASRRTYQSLGPEPPRSASRRGSTQFTFSPDNSWNDEEYFPFRPPQSVPDGSGVSHNDADDASERSTSITKENWIKGAVSWLWICQADVLPGYVATPWQDHFPESTCFGTIAIMLEALSHFTNVSTLQYVERLPHCESWIFEGKSTYPCYAINARGGMIVKADYKCAKFNALMTKIPPIQLLHPDPSKRHPGHAHRTNSTSVIVDSLAELMSLDSWLSFCGRLPEICNGRNNLLQKMPALVQKLMTDFEYEFGNIDRSAAEGGLQLIKEMAHLVLDELGRLMLEEGERLFTIVAVLRAAKMALCVVQGPRTEMLRDILLRDVQVYLV